jgi:hypothetical protein
MRYFIDQPWCDVELRLAASSCYIHNHSPEIMQCSDRRFCDRMGHELLSAAVALLPVCATHNAVAVLNAKDEPAIGS